MRTVIILMGCPGAGKGTQGTILSERLRAPRISTGDMLREHVARGTAVGPQIARQMSSGGLVDGDLVNEVVIDRISHSDCRSGFILDGYPRAIEQAEFLARHLDSGASITAIEIRVSCGQLLERLTTRRNCSSCGAIYNLMTAPPLRRNLCDHCGSAISRRDDDRDEVVAARFQSYTNSTAPLASYYRSRGMYYSVNGGVSVEEVSRQIQEALMQSKTGSATKRLYLKV